MAAPAGNKFAEGHGRPTKYKLEYDDQAYKLCLLGATDKEIADFFEVSESTINEWKLEFESFSESIREGKELSDMKVVSSLLDSCHDRLIKTQQAFKVKNVYYDESGKRIESEKVEIVDIMQGVPANDRSIQFWLKNRHPDKWRDKQEIDHTTKGEKIIFNVKLKKPNE